MALVTVRINGTPHTVGCLDGQEAHLQAMAAEVDRRLQSLTGQAAAQSGSAGGVQGGNPPAPRDLPGPAGESRLFVLAALTLADELHDLQDELRSSQAELEQARWMLNQKPREVVREVIREVPRDVPVPDSVYARKLQSLAARAEEIAAGLERT